MPNPIPQPTFLPSRWLSAGFLVLLGVLIPLFVFGASDFVIDDFEGYNLGDLAGQGGWEAGASFPSLQVNADKFQHGLQSIKSSVSYTEIQKTTAEEITNGTQSFWFWSELKVGWKIRLLEETYPDRIEIYNSTAGIRYALTGEVICDVPTSEWINFQIEWDCPINKVRFNCNFAGWTDWKNSRDLDYISVFYITTEKANIYFDNLTGEYIPEMEIVGISPESGSEITDFGTNLTIEYRYFDWEIYNGFIVNFIDKKIGSLANSILFEKDDLDPSGTGQKTIGLENFGIDSNGRWDLTGLGFGTKLDIEGGMFLTTRGYIDFWTNELVLDPYYLIINVEGLPEFYAFTDAPTWYSANVERFDAPTAFFTSFVNLMTPTFEKLGEFGRKTLTLFDSNESYDRGYALGEIFPLINAYIKKIDLFFGGFPLASFFKYLILLMFAGFIIRTILKFIPMLG